MDLVAPALQDLRIGQDFRGAAGIDVIDPAIDASVDHVGPIAEELGALNVLGQPALVTRALPTMVSTRFQCPPRATAETMSPVFPSRRYSMSGL